MRAHGACVGFAVERSGFWKGDGGDLGEAERAAVGVQCMQIVQQCIFSSVRVKTLCRSQAQLLGLTSYSAVSYLILGGEYACFGAAVCYRGGEQREPLRRCEHGCCQQRSFGATTNHHLQGAGKVGIQHW
jgi:hypothetical protein